MVRMPQVKTLGCAIRSCGVPYWIFRARVVPCYYTVTCALLCTGHDTPGGYVRIYTWWRIVCGPPEVER